MNYIIKGIAGIWLSIASILGFSSPQSEPAAIQAPEIIEVEWQNREEVVAKDPIVEAAKPIMVETSVKQVAPKQIVEIEPAILATSTIKVETIPDKPKTYTLPSGKIVDGEGNVLNQAELDAKNRELESMAEAKIRALSLEQLRVAEAESKAKMDAYNAQIKNDKIQALKNQIFEFNKIELALRDEISAMRERYLNYGSPGGRYCYESTFCTNFIRAKETEIENLNSKRMKIQLELNYLTSK